MEKLSAFFKKLWEKFKAFGKIIRITIIVAIVAVIAAIVIAIASASKVKYATLFYDLDSADAQTVMTALDEQAVDYKVEGSDILVDSTKVDKLRLNLSSNLSSSSKGYELMDDSSSFGMTDEEFQIYKVRMIQGEIERSIKTLDAIKNCKVMITPAQDSVFVQSATEGNASIVVELNPGVELSRENVQAIVSMVSMGTENIPEENIAVVDTDGNLLTKDLNKGDSSTDGSNTVTSETITSQYDQEKNYEDKIAKKVVDLLEPIVGPNNVQAQVNADLDFDSKKISEYEIDPNDVLISQETENSYNSANSGDSTSESPVDNNMSNTIEDENGDKSSSSTEHQINNYDHSNKKTETVKAPGEVRRLTVSVFVNGKLDEETQKAFEDAVKSATGYDETRQDSISVVGMNFDTTIDDRTQEQIDKYNAAQKAAERNKLIKYIVLGVVALLIVGTIIIVILKKRHAEEEEEEDKLLDVVVGDDTEPVEYEPIDFQNNDEKTHIENEIKKYATEKPDQVAEIVKSWLNDSER